MAIFALVPDWSATPSENSAQPGIPMFEGMEPADVNDSIRTIMAAIKLMHTDLTADTSGTLNAKYLRLDLTNTTPVFVAALKVLLGLGGTTSVSVGTLETGDVKPTFRATASAGWIMCDGSTIGNPTSGAIFADATASDLFTLLWNEFDNSVLIIQDSTGAASTRGVSPAADFAAGKRLPVFDLRGRFLRGYSGASSLDSGRAFGSVQLDAMQGHFHPPKGADSGSPGGQYGFNVWSSTLGNGHGAPTGTGSNPEGTTGAPVTDGANGTPRTAAETRPNNVACNWVIKV